MKKVNATIVISLCFLCTVFSTKGQTTVCGTPADTVKRAKLSIHADPRLHTLIKETRKKNKENPKINGYRIQIYFGNNREEARKVRSEFLKKYSEHKAYLVYQQPNFKIRIGNFRNKLEAQKLYYELQDKFNTVFIVPTKIELPKLGR